MVIRDSEVLLSECLRVMFDVLINSSLFKKETTLPSFNKYLLKNEWYMII